MFPFMTAYDPPGTGEGSLDPLGLYQIADQLAVQLVPAVRERMQRVRFLTAMAVGALVTAELDDDSRNRDASPYLVWEWLVVEAMIRTRREDPSVWGVPGTLVTRRALDQYGYVDARSYLKTPRIFGFHGVYKRLATHLGIVDVHLGPGPNAEPLADAWARGMKLGNLGGARPLLARWTAGIRRSFGEQAPRTRPAWNSTAWEQLAAAFVPSGAKAREKRFLRRLLLTDERSSLGALPTVWELQPEFDDDGYQEEALHEKLTRAAPEYAPILEAIRAYELFGRRLQDAFDLLKAEAAGPDAQGFPVSRIAKDDDFKRCTGGLHGHFETAHRALDEVVVASRSLSNLFSERFGAFAEPMDASACAFALCEHHETVQQEKSATGKRPWFDRIGKNRIYIRHQYRESRPQVSPDRYVHDYRGWPIRRFHSDLS